MQIFFAFLYERYNHERAPDRSPPLALEQLFEVDKQNSKQDQLRQKGKALYMVERQFAETDHRHHTQHLHLAEYVRNHRHDLGEVIALHHHAAVHDPLALPYTRTLAP